ncbi:hypothetical protein F383_20530 [Gossypium arboreum]
MENKH